MASACAGPLVEKPIVTPRAASSASAAWSSLSVRAGLSGVSWGDVKKVGLALLVSPLIGFVLSALLLLLLKLIFRSPRLHTPPKREDRPPATIRAVLIGTCGGVSFAHGANDGQKGMGLLLLVLIGFFPLHYALTVNKPEFAAEVFAAVGELRQEYAKVGAEVPRSGDPKNPRPAAQPVISHENRSAQGRSRISGQSGRGSGDRVDPPIQAGNTPGRGVRFQDTFCDGFGKSRRGFA